MGILLYRVDERLIHGQVTVGWGSQLKPRRYLVVDDNLPESDFERDLYRLGAPTGTRAEFCTVQEARSRLAGWRADSEPSILLTRDLDHMSRLAEAGLLRGEAVNLGGIHHRPQRSKVLPYLYLDKGDRGLIARIMEQGATVSAQDLPGSAEIPGRALIDA